MQIKIMSTALWRNTIAILAFSQMTLAWNIKCFCGSYDVSVVVNSDNVTKLYDHPECFSKCPVNGTFIFFHGFSLGGPNDIHTPPYLKLYIRYGGKNVCLVNASQEFAGPALLYPLAAKNTQIVGQEVAVALCKLFTTGLSLKGLRLAGLSIGAHTAGKVGSCVKIDCNKTIPRITGLDPAGPMFDNPVYIRRLTKEDADFVDIIHTDPGTLLFGNYGITVSTGHLDCWVNAIFYLNGTNRQPGCPTGIQQPMTPAAFCSHVRSMKIEGEALFKPDGLLTTEAKDYYTWVKNDGALIGLTPLGEKMDQSCRNNHYIRTNSEPDYGLGLEGVKPEQ